MARPSILPQSVLEALGQQLAAPAAAMLPPDSGFGTDPGAPAAQIGNSFPIWLVTYDALHHADASLAEIAQDTGTWHHQVTVADRAVAYAHSDRSGSGEPRVFGWSTDSLALAVNHAIDEVDRLDAPDTAEVRLLVAPVFDVTAFWLADDNQPSVLVVEAPDEEALPLHRLLTEAEFLAALRRLPTRAGRRRGRPPTELRMPEYAAGRIQR